MERILKKYKKGEEDKFVKCLVNDIGVGVNGMGLCILIFLK